MEKFFFARRGDQDSGRVRSPESARGYFFRAARVRAAFFAAADRSLAVRFRAAARVCRESASFEAAWCPSRFNARKVARERRRDTAAVPRVFPFSISRFAFLRVSSGTLPSFGSGSFTPARRAFDRPMAMACFAERAPCSPLRMDSISSRTNSPACVEGAFPSRARWRARSMVFFVGISIPPIAGRIVFGRVNVAAGRSIRVHPDLRLAAVRAIRLV